MVWSSEPLHNPNAEELSVPSTDAFYAELALQIYVVHRGEELSLVSHATSKNGFDTIQHGISIHFPQFCSSELARKIPKASYIFQDFQLSLMCKIQRTNWQKFPVEKTVVPRLVVGGEFCGFVMFFHSLAIFLAAKNVDFCSCLKFSPFKSRGKIYGEDSGCTKHKDHKAKKNMISIDFNWFYMISTTFWPSFSLGREGLSRRGPVTTHGHQPPTGKHLRCHIETVTLVYFDQKMVSSWFKLHFSYGSCFQINTVTSRFWG